MRNYRTKNEFIQKNYPELPDAQIIGVDGGYSSFKAATGKSLFAFPSAVKMSGGQEILAKLPANTIRIQDNNSGEEYFVGDLAEDLLSPKEIDALSDDSMYSRYHYTSPNFRRLMTAALGCAVLKNGAENKSEIYVCSGVPTEYTADAPMLQDVISGDYSLNVAIGGGNFVPVKFHVAQENVYISEQAKASLIPIVYDNNGQIIRSRMDIYGGPTIIDDNGFMTEDILTLEHNILSPVKTSRTDTGMHAVYEAVIKDMIAENPGVKCKIHELPKFLEAGIYKYMDFASFSQKTFDFTPSIEKYNKLLAEKSVKELINSKGADIANYKYLILTGGTNELRYNMIKDALRGLPDLTIYRGNENDPTVPMRYSNSIGYYILQLLRLRQQMFAKNK